MTRHIALLGDSIFDNESYCEGGPSVTAHLRSMIPAGWTATLCARDGAITADIGRQLSGSKGVLAEATDLVLSVGGNDGLLSLDVLEEKVKTTGAGLDKMHDILMLFERNYIQAIDSVLRLGKPLTVCTIYNGAFDAQTARVIRMAVMLYNNVILRTAVARDLPVIDLGAVCTEPSDYFNPIEPSSAGGARIARAILDKVSRSVPRGSPRLD